MHSFKCKKGEGYTIGKLLNIGYNLILYVTYCTVLMFGHSDMEFLFWEDGQQEALFHCLKNVCCLLPQASSASSMVIEWLSLEQTKMKIHW